MAINEIHVGDIGTAFRVTLKDQDGVVQDISSASSLILKFRKPSDGTVTEKTGSLYTDGTDGKLQYVTTSASDLDVTGNWQLQVKIVIAGAVHHSDISVFKVEPNLS